MKIVYFTLLLLALLAAYTYLSLSPAKHACTWVQCPINDLGEAVVNDPASDTDCYIYTHSVHPNWEYSEVEQFVFSVPAIKHTTTR